MATVEAVEIEFGRGAMHGLCECNYWVEGVFFFGEWKQDLGACSRFRHRGVPVKRQLI